MWFGIDDLLLAAAAMEKHVIGSQSLFKSRWEDMGFSCTSYCINISVRGSSNIANNCLTRDLLTNLSYY